MADSEFGVVEASGLLIFDPAGPAAVLQEGMRITALDLAVVPGVAKTGFRVTFDPAVSLSPAVGVAQFLASDGSMAQYRAAIAVDLTPANRPIVYVVDGAGNPINLSDVALAAPPGVFWGIQLHAVTAGSKSIP
jgi:hypothetical protein